LKKEIIIKIIDFHQGNCTKEEIGNLKMWIYQNEENKKFFDDITNLWFASGTSKEQFRYSKAKALESITSRIAELEKKRTGNRKLIKLFTGKYAKIAAAILLSFSLGVLVNRLTEQKVETGHEIASSTTVIKSPIGSKSEIILPDGSKVWLNAGSVLSYNTAFNQKDRTVNLTGEGYFSISKNPDKPFVVKVEDLKVRVYGTEFNLKAYPEEGVIQTTLIEGSLSMIKKDKYGNEVETMLEPDQKLTYVKEEGKILLSEKEKRSIEGKTTINNLKGKLLIDKNAETDVISSWKDHKLVFRNESFESLSIKLERWFDVDIDVADKELMDYHFNGIIENETFEEVLEIIKYTIPIEYEIKQGKITIHTSK